MTEDPSSLVSALLQMAEVTSQVLDAVDGHKAELLRRGYSETAAEQMAVQLHGAFIALVFAKAAALPR